MTIGAYIIFGILTIGILIIGGIGLLESYSTAGKIASIIIPIVIIIALWGVGFWYYNNTESGKRAIKTQESDFNGGIKRKVTVYDVEGDVIVEYQGKFDVEYDDDRILFDDEEGLRHIIYYPTGNVIVDEVK